MKKMSDVPSTWKGSKFNESSLIKPKSGRMRPIRGFCLFLTDSLADVDDLFQGHNLIFIKKQLIAWSLL